MYYQRRPTQYHLRHYHRDTEEAECIRDPVRLPASLSRTVNLAGIHSTAQNSRHGHTDNFNNLCCGLCNGGHGGTPPAASWMTSYPQGDGIPCTMTSPPSPSDCKPPYSYISLIAMAIESSPGHRSISVYILYLNPPTVAIQP